MRTRELTLTELPDQPHKIDNFIAGSWVKPKGLEFTIESPYFGKVIGVSHESTLEDINNAVKSAKSAQALWGKTPLKERTQVLFKFRSILLSEADEISKIVALESGKTFTEAKAGLMKGIEVLEYALSLQNSDQGGKMEVSRGVTCEYIREPLGVVASVTPFNFPAMVVMWTLPIALVLGNAYMWKPSEKTPLTSKFIANALNKAGLPSGVFSVLQGGQETVEFIIDHTDIKAIGFVGSSRVAKAVYKRASNHGKRALALGGAKNHIVLLPDADVELAGQGISDSFTGCAGQRCMAASVLLAVGDVDRHIQQIKHVAEATKIGDGMGAIITKQQVDFLNAAIDRAIYEGAQILVDGRNPKVPEIFKEGYWIGPTILTGLKPESEAVKNELFGPILTIVPCKTITEALEIENSNPYGNACSVFTNSGHFAQKVISNAKSAMVGVNIGVPVPREPFSFGGMNESKFGHGDITGPASLNFWSDLKKVTCKWQKQKDDNWMS